MHADAIAWAETILGTAVTEVMQLTGGLTSTMLALTGSTGQHVVLRLMTKDPWRRHGAELTSREEAALHALAATPVLPPTSLALDALGEATGVAAHLMSGLPGVATQEAGEGTVAAMADTLATIHAVDPVVPFRHFQSWAWEAKRVVPPWTTHGQSWERAFGVLAGEPPRYFPTFLHRDFSHRNLLWDGGAISGVVDWVETSTGPAWLDAGHAATTLALDFGPEPARAFLAWYGELVTEAPQRYWLVLDAVGFLPAPGSDPLFNAPRQLRRLDEWLHAVISEDVL